MLNLLTSKKLQCTCLNHPSTWLPLNDLCPLIFLNTYEHHSHRCAGIGSCDQWNIAGYYAIYEIRTKNIPSLLPFLFPLFLFFPFSLFLSFHRRSQMPHHKDICLSNPMKRNSQALWCFVGSFFCPVWFPPAV